MTDQEKTQAREEVRAAIKHIEIVLDFHGSRLEYRNIALIYPVLEQLRVLEWQYAPSCYS